MTPPTWDAFAEALPRELAGLADGVLLVIRSKDRSWDFAQFAQDAHELHAEVSGERVNLPPIARQDTPEGRRILESHGWQPPDEDAGFLWHRVLPRPAREADLRAVAAGVVAALRDVNGIAGPQRLQYDAWNPQAGNRHWPVDLPGVEYQQT
nr:hypothetical protein GCM10020063_026760 [Dactylosporangium thailandense]